MKRVYVQSRTDDGGFASRGLAPLGDSAAVMPGSEFVEVLRRSGAPTDDATSEEASMKSVPVVPGGHYTDTRPVSGVHPLSDFALLVPQSERLAGFNPNRCAVCLGILSKPKGVTYIAQRQQWVKIGRTSGPVHRRIKKLNGQVPQVLMPDGMDHRKRLILLHVIGHDVEHALHERYAAHHAAGEWFWADISMLAEIAAMADGRAA